MLVFPFCFRNWKLISINSWKGNANYTIICTCLLTLIYTVLTIALKHKITSSYLFHNNDTFYICIMCIHLICFVIRLSLLILMFFLISVWRVCMLLSSQIVTVFLSLKVNLASKPHNESNTLTYVFIANKLWHNLDTIKWYW